jgi:hypothetical protein
MDLRIVQSIIAGLVADKVPVRYVRCGFENVLELTAMTEESFCKTTIG